MIEYRINDYPVVYQGIVGARVQPIAKPPFGVSEKTSKLQQKAT
jgi:hypothetical protein